MIDHSKQNIFCPAHVAHEATQWAFPGNAFMHYSQPQNQRKHSNYCNNIPPTALHGIFFYMGWGVYSSLEKRFPISHQTLSPNGILLHTGQHIFTNVQGTTQRHH
jgi:hypothetical protein